MTVLIGENDTWHHRPLFTEIVRRAHAAGLAGASVFRGVEGFGASSLIHTSRLLSLGEDLPVAVVVVDAEDRIRAFLPHLDELVAQGLVVLDEVEVIRYSDRRAGARDRRRRGPEAYGPGPAGPALGDAGAGGGGTGTDGAGAR